MKRILFAVLMLLCVGTSAMASTVVMQGGCGVFAAPDTDSTTLGHIDAGQRLAYLGQWQEDSDGMRWYEVEYYGAPGWVPARYAQLTDRGSQWMTRQPSYYIGAWQGDGGEYYLYINDFDDDEKFSAVFDIYRIWGFDNAVAVLEGSDIAVFEAQDEKYDIMGRLIFREDTLSLEILFSDFPGIDKGETIAFERANF